MIKNVVQIYFWQKQSHDFTALVNDGLKVNYYKSRWASKTLFLI